MAVGSWQLAKEIQVKSLKPARRFLGGLKVKSKERISGLQNFRVTELQNYRDPLRFMQKEKNFYRLLFI
ncbi:MAG: hypothetical protein AB9834_16585 [Lentimicrobium sp.]